MDVIKEKIDLLLRQADIEGLLQSEAPKDEYSSEAEAIAMALSAIEDSEISHELVLKIVEIVWAKSFGLNESNMSSR